MLPYVVSERNTIMLSLDATIIYRIPALLMALTVHEYAHGAMSTHLVTQPQVRRGALR